MKYQELLDEYKQLLRDEVHLKQQLQAVPKGYIVMKRISGREYAYLQYSKQGKKKSVYIPKKEVPATKAAIACRSVIKQKLEVNHVDQERLECAVRILDKELARIFWHLKQCAAMDALPLARRSQALSFAKAMTALEGTPAQPETEEDLQLWAVGEKSYAEIYMKVLHKYGILKNAQTLEWEINRCNIVQN